MSAPLIRTNTHRVTPAQPQHVTASGIKHGSVTDSGWHRASAPLASDRRDFTDTHAFKLLTVGLVFLASALCMGVILYAVAMELVVPAVAWLREALA